MKKKFIALLLAAATSFAAIASLSGCTPATDKEEQNTLTLTCGAMIPQKFIDGLCEKFPEINFDIEYYQGANQTEYVYQSLIHGEASDIFMHTLCVSEEDAEQYLVDLSGYKFLGNFDNAILDTMSKDGKIYQVSGPVSSRCILYNKTLFEMNGWKVPTTFNELLETVKQIRTDTPDITPIAMGMVAPGYPFTIVTSFAQCGFLSTPDGADWEQRYFRGEASVAEGFAEGFTMVEQLIDANAFDGEKYVKLWNVVSGDPCERKAAMSICLSGTQSVLPLIERTANPEVYGEYCTDDFGLLPFFGIEDGQQGLSITLSSTWGINKRLEEKGNEKKLENALKVMEFLSTAEGQLLLQTDNGQIPTVKDITNTNIHSEVKKLWELNENGKKSIYLYSGYEDIIVEAGEIVMEAMLADSSEGMREKFVSVSDEIHAKTVSGAMGTKSYGTVSENLTIEETAKLFMSAIKNGSGADLVLATHRGLDNGVLNKYGYGGRLFSGEVSETILNVIIPTYNTMIETVELTGNEVKNLLQNGKTITEGEQEGHFDYIVYGADAVESNGTVVSVKLNGVELDDNSTYTVAFSQADYDEAFTKSHTVTATEFTVFGAIEKYLAENSPISAANIK